MNLSVASYLLSTASKQKPYVSLSKLSEKSFLSILSSNLDTTCTVLSLGDIFFPYLEKCAWKLNATIAIYCNLNSDKIKTQSVIFQESAFAKSIWWKWYDYNHWNINDRSVLREAMKTTLHNLLTYVAKLKKINDL